jgi:hypothetical protein
MSWYARKRPAPVTFLTTLLISISGLYGFDVRGFDALPRLQIHYWSEALRVLRREIGADVVVTRVPPYECPLFLNPVNIHLPYSQKGLAPWLNALEDSTKA